ncbi:MAG: Gfo/Idh/MocA family oxidoreductase [Candidatus Omnitrophica bacterium]|nr:Gfo/Idh/MocA family oxidoreductase [Candidatus Omnitrophota bacterium]MCM8824686.1 Gfo/Idh/MocA family oxidoreductase [Candidatus Omnitrophota bacterium]
MLRVGIIGFGLRVSHMAAAMKVFSIPYKIAAIADPAWPEIKKAVEEKTQETFLRRKIDLELMQDTKYFSSADEMLDSVELDGVMVGTRCYLHTEMACKVAKRNLPLFLEKPVAITFEQLKTLDKTFQNVTAPVVVSFPLRLSSMAMKVRQIIESGRIGEIEHVVAWNDVPYGSVYFNNWYRNYNEVGGLFLQKATHDFDYIFFLTGRKPKMIAAMNSQRIYGKRDKPFELLCRDCDEKMECIESPFNLFYKRFKGDKVDWNNWQKCMFSKDIKNEDSGNALIELDNGVQVSYSQNFFVRNQAVGRRGARLYGYKGTIDFDWYRKTIIVYDHIMPTTETIEFGGDLPHFGGDRELAYDFLLAMKEKRPSRSPIEAGIISALTCLWARESAEKKKFFEVKMP